MLAKINLLRNSVYSVAQTGEASLWRRRAVLGDNEKFKGNSRELAEELEHEKEKTKCMIDAK